MLPSRKCHRATLSDNGPCTTRLNQTLPAQIPNPTWIKVKFPIPGWPFVSNFLLQRTTGGQMPRWEMSKSSAHRLWVIQCSVRTSMSYHGEYQVLNFQHLASRILKLTWRISKFQYWTNRILNLKDLTSRISRLDGHTFLNANGLVWHGLTPSTRLWVSYLSKKVPGQVNSYLTTVLTVFGGYLPSLS